MLFKLSNLNSNLALTLGYLNPALNNSALISVAMVTNPRLKLIIFRASNMPRLKISKTPALLYHEACSLKI